MFLLSAVTFKKRHSNLLTARRVRPAYNSTGMLQRYNFYKLPHATLATRLHTFLCLSMSMKYIRMYDFECVCYVGVYDFLMLSLYVFFFDGSLNEFRLDKSPSDQPGRRAIKRKNYDFHSLLIALGDIRPGKGARSPLD